MTGSTDSTGSSFTSRKVSCLGSPIQTKSQARDCNQRFEIHCLFTPNDVVSPARLAVVIWVVLLAQWSIQWSERKKVAQVYTRTAFSAILRDRF